MCPPFSFNMRKTIIDYGINLQETQIVKAFAIVLMLIHHLFLDHPEFGLIPHSLAIAGKVCVALFVFLSGYGIAVTFPKNISGHLSVTKATLLFLGKRLVKFFLNYWVVFFIAIPIGVLCFNRSLESAYGNTNVHICFIRDVFGLQGFNSYNITWWFNRLIIVLWLLFPILYWAMMSKIVSLSFLVFLFINPGDILYVFELAAKGLSIYIFPFCIGIFAALHSERINKILNIVPSRVVLYGSFIATFCLFLLRGVPLASSFSYFRVDPFLTVALVLAIVSACRVTKLRFAMLQYVGRHSMNMYLTHTFILGYFFSEYIYGLKNPVLMFIAVFGASLFVSVVLEFIKRQSGFYRLQNWVAALLTKHISLAGENSNKL